MGHPDDQLLIVGRAAVRVRLERLIAEICLGRRAVLVLRGEAGIGKTALLRFARTCAAGVASIGASGEVAEAGGAVQRDAAVRCLEISCVESESSVAFAGLSQLLHSLREEIDPVRSAPERLLNELLYGSLADLPDRFAVGTALLQLLTSLTSQRPALLLVDDLHWIDADSRDALMFVIRRMQDDGIGFVASTRLPTGVDRVTAGLPDLELRGFARDELEEFLSRRSGGVVAASVVDRVWQETGGNPLAALEIFRVLDPEHLAGTAALPATFTCRTAEELFADRVLSLSASAADLLVLLAIAAGASSQTALRAARDLGFDLGLLDEIEDAGLASVAGGRVVLDHPLVRSAAIANCSAVTVRRMHRSLADAMAGEPAARLRRLWHLAAAVRGPSDQAAQAMAALAHHERSAGGFGAAVLAYEQAAQLATSTDLEAEYLVAAADCARMSGDRERADALAARARPLCRSPAQLAMLDAVGGLMRLLAGPTQSASDALLRSAREVSDSAPAEATALYTYAAAAQLMCGLSEVAVATASTAISVAESQSLPVPPVAQMILGRAMIRRGQVSAGMNLISAGARAVQAGSEYPVEQRLMAAVALIWAGDHREAHRILAAQVDSLRGLGALGMLPFALSMLAYTQVRAGKLTSAHTAASEAVQLAVDTGDVTFRHAAHGVLALIASYRGRETDCRDHALTARRMRREFDISYPRDELDALGLLELGLGHPSEAASYLMQANSINGQVTFGRLTGPELVEACVQSGQSAPAVLVAAAREHVERVDLLYPAAQAARILGLLADGGEAETHFEHALRCYDALDLPLDTGRTELVYGERLRRIGRRADARIHLQRAINLFDDSGADLWALRARAELRATGLNVTPRTPSPVESLTPQEHRVAVVIADGATNREAAAALFLSEKTIETHLSRVYRKLGVRNRSELAKALP